MGLEKEIGWSSFAEIIDETIKRVEEIGDPNNHSIWKEAYPEVEFEEVDESFSGKPIEWEKRTKTEMAFYVNYMNNPQDVEVFYEIEVEGSLVKQKIDDSERLWWMWLYGCFKSMSEKVVDDKAKMVFFGYTNTGPYQSILDNVISSDDIEVLSWNAKMKVNN